jgi:hypothetical protein
LLRSPAASRAVIALGAHQDGGVISGVLAAFFIARQRFADCREAYGALNSIQCKETSPAPQSSAEDNLLLEEAIKCIACDCLP